MNTGPVTQRRVCLLLVLLATFAVYANSLAGDFTMDDRELVVGVTDAGIANERIYTLQPLSVYFSSSFWADTVEGDEYFRPVTVLTFALRHWLVGDSPFAAHLINVLLQLWVTGLVFALLGRLGAGPIAAALGALVFGVHAVHTEVVANIAGRSYMLGFGFGSTALLLLLPRTSRSRAIGAAACLFLAFCSNEGAVAWLPFLLVTAFALRVDWAAIAKLLLLTLLPLAAFLYLRHRMLSQIDDFEPRMFVVNPIHAAPLATRALTATAVLGYGLWLTIAPFRLACDYGAAVFTVRDGVDLGVVAGALAMIGIAAVGLFAGRRQPILFVGAAALLGFSLVTSNHLLPIGTIFGDRLMYAPSFGISCAVAWLATRLWKHPSQRRVLVIGIGAWCLASGAMAIHRNAVWWNNERLFSNDIQVVPNSVRLLDIVSDFDTTPQKSEALRHLEKAVALDPEDAAMWIKLASIRLELGEVAQARAALDRASRAKHVDRRNDLCNLFGNRGLLHLRSNEPREAIAAFTRALVAKPSSYGTWSQLLQIDRNSLSRVLDECEQQKPGLPHWRAYRGLVANLANRHADAVTAIEGVLPELSGPRSVELRSYASLILALSMRAVGRAQEALTLMTRLRDDMHVHPNVRRQAARILGG